MMLLKMLPIALALNLLLDSVQASDQPSRYTELLDYVQEGPDQGRTASCLFVASTGAMELIANKKHGLKNPMAYGKYDLAESFLMHAPVHTRRGKNFFEIQVLKFNIGYGIHIDDWPFDAWDDLGPIRRVWNSRDWRELKKVKLPNVETVPLFRLGNKWSMNVLEFNHIQQVKKALLTYRAPIMVNYNDNGFWHVVLIVGYDDKLPGNCYQITKKECETTTGSFYIRDSFGRHTELRDYDWFRVKANAAIIIKENE
jgi:hypothetical protein